MPLTAHGWMADESNPVKRYLMEYQSLCQRREALLCELARLRDAATRATAVIGGDRPSGAPNPAARENALLRLCDGEARLSELAEHIGESLAARLVLIDQLADERQKTLLTLRYINGLGWETIGHRMHYERTQVFDIHHRALDAAAQAWAALGGGRPAGEADAYPGRME